MDTKKYLTPMTLSSCCQLAAQCKIIEVTREMDFAKEVLDKLKKDHGENCIMIKKYGVLLGQFDEILAELQRLLAGQDQQ